MKEWVDYLRQHKPRGECSLCEVPLPPDKVADLLAWPQKARAAHLQQALDNDYLDPSRGYSAADSLGLTLLWFAALYGRENATEGEIWPHVAHQFPADSRAVLFVQSHPRQALKAAMESCCKRFELRHAFGRHGGQAYYVTVYLQFGFTRRGLEHLPQWLAGYQVPTAVRILLQESPPFQQLWALLRAGKSAPENPFWPHGWTGAPQESSQGVRLVWNEELEFELDFAQLFPGLDDGSYQLEEPYEWIQIIDGSPNPPTVTCPAEQAQLALSLSCLGEGDPRFAEVILWTDELQLWDQRGKPRRSGLPEPGWTVHLPEGWRVHSPTLRLQGRWAQLAEVPLVIHDDQGAVQEWSRSDSQPLQAVTLAWEQQPITLLPQCIEGLLRNVPQGARICQGEVTDFFGSLHLRCELPADLDKPSWAVRLQHQGRSRTVRADLDVKLITWKTEEGWRTFDDQGRLDVGTLQSRPFRFLGDYSVYGILEGNRFLGRPGEGTSLLKGLSGYGAPLVLRRGPFNPQDEPDRRLISCLAHQGICRRLHLDGDNYRLELRQTLWPGPEHFLLFWDGNTLIRQAYAESGPLPMANPILVAVGYASAWLGGVWTRNRPPQRPDDPWLAAHIMRWAHLPLLEYTSRSLARQWMRGQELTFIKAWVEPHFQGLQHREDEGWSEVLRSLLPPDLEIDRPQARELLQTPWQTWLSIHPRFLEHLLSRGECTQEIVYLNRVLQGDLEREAERQMGVDRRWLEEIMQAYYFRHENRDLEVALAFPTFQRLLLRESLR